MPKGIYKNKKCLIKFHPPFTPNEHQINVMNYFSDLPHKGLLLYHKLGSGKTCTSIMVADNLLSNKKINKVFIITPGSLRSSWIKEYCAKCGIDNDYLAKYFTFITYNYDVNLSLKSVDFDNSLVIIDEVHNLINGVKNTSVNPLSIYNKIYNSNCKVLALSGTPVMNGIYEFAILGNILKENTFPNLLEYKNDKYKFNLTEANNLNSTDNWYTEGQLNGIISYYPGDITEFPEVIYKKPIKCKLNPMQASFVKEKYEIETRIRKTGPPSEKLKIEKPQDYEIMKKLFIMASMWVSTRKASNFIYFSKDTIFFGKDGERIKTPFVFTDEFIFSNSKIKTLKDKEKSKEKDEIWKSEKILPDLLEKEGGWINDDIFSDRKLITIFSPKIASLLVNITLHPNTKHMVYTFFKKKSGVQIIKTLLKKCGITCKIFSGDLDDMERTSLLNRFNSEENRNGEKIQVVLVTGAGTEGITLLEVNNVHILESSISGKKTEQAIGRAVRYKSHSKMPKERRYVNVWRYWSVSPNGDELIDENLYNNSKSIVDKVDKFTDVLVNNSI